MKFKIVDREKTGFAKYCPTFARAYEVMAEKIRRRRLVKNLAKKLGSEDPNVRENAAKALGYATANEKSRQEALEVLVKALGDKNQDVRWRAAWALWGAAKKGVDISAAVGALVKALDDENSDVRRGAGGALGSAAWEGVDISAAVGALVKALDDENSLVRMNATWALGEAVANEKTREAGVREMLIFMDSSWFMREAENNSDAFIGIVNALDKALRKVKKAERKVVYSIRY